MYVAVFDTFTSSLSYSMENTANYDGILADTFDKHPLFNIGTTIPEQPCMKPDHDVRAKQFVRCFGRN